MAEKLEESRPGYNTYNPEKIRTYVTRVENLEDNILSEKGSYMAAVKMLREDIKTVLDEAKDDGIPKKELKTVIKTRALERKKKPYTVELTPVLKADIRRLHSLGRGITEIGAMTKVSYKDIVAMLEKAGSILQEKR